METAHFARNEAAGMFGRTGFDSSFTRAAKQARGLSWLTSRIQIPETIELPTDRPVMIAANHSSLFDIVSSIIVLDHFGVPARLGVHARFFNAPIGGRLLHRIGCVPFSREVSDVAEQTMVDALADRQVCCLMPEGRVVRAEQRVNGVGEGRPGISRIARAAGAAIVPVGFAGADRAWPPGSAMLRLRSRHPVVTTLGAPIEFTGDDHDANVAELMGAISKLVAVGSAPVTGDR